MLPLISILYHGTAEKIQKIDVLKGRNNKDFGRGFYMAVSKSQALGMMHKKYREAIARRPNTPKDNFSENLYEIKIDLEYAKSLNIKYFQNANEEWLDFILMCREEGGLPHNFDLVIGPTADDDTMICLNSYWRGFYGEVGSSEAKEKLLDYLEPENLGIQYFIGKQEVADKLILVMNEIKWS
jgi:hypothetical protein